MAIPTGAIVTIALAVAAAWRPIEPMRGDRAEIVLDLGASDVALGIEHELGRTVIEWFVLPEGFHQPSPASRSPELGSTSFVWRWPGWARCVKQARAPHPRYPLYVLGSGWPLRAMWTAGGVRSNLTRPTRVVRGIARGGARSGWPSIVPTGLVPFGFTFDTMFWGAAAYGAGAGALGVRRSWRRRRGRCVACGYNLRGGEGGRWPECGHTELFSPSANAALEGAGR